LPDIETASPIETTVPTDSNVTTDTTSTPLPLTHIKVWLTTSDDPNASMLATLEAGSVETLYIWARGLVGQQGDFVLVATLQDGRSDQLGHIFHTSIKGYTIDCGQWYGGFLKKKGKVSVNAISNGNVIGDVAFTIY